MKTASLPCGYQDVQQDLISEYKISHILHKEISPPLCEFSDVRVHFHDFYRVRQSVMNQKALHVHLV
ncbi:hypothetical protein GDO81_019801 [Engystomops pustulosus]|uniref:Uncharacterized protein n=1 Tax=Engystomops pustulosus TaxID=76066 RepID=A0AAV6YYU1_ENGPU|nr:hypothetical protein GDO81_019801 [Engystomops pustulosus]KAG8540135.1 hypothetical protein GDO81_019801 [Engystomops pustulosus]